MFPPTRVFVRSNSVTLPHLLSSRSVLQYWQNICFPFTRIKETLVHYRRVENPNTHFHLCRWRLWNRKTSDVLNLAFFVTLKGSDCFHENQLVNRRLFVPFHAFLCDSSCKYSAVVSPYRLVAASLPVVFNMFLQQFHHIKPFLLLWVNKLLWFSN